MQFQRRDTDRVPGSGAKSRPWPNLKGSGRARAWSRCSDPARDRRIRSFRKQGALMADDKLAPAISAQGWQHLEQGVTESAEKAYGALVALSPAKRLPWE